MRWNAHFGFRHPIGGSRRATRTKTSSYPYGLTVSALGRQCCTHTDSFRSLVGTLRKRCRISTGGFLGWGGGGGGGKPVKKMGPRVGGKFFWRLFFVGGQKK